MAQNTSSKSLLNFSNEILLNIISRLSPVSTICLALTSYEFYAFILEALDKRRLNEIVQYRTAHYHPYHVYIKLPDDHLELLNLLAIGWAPKHFGLCLKFGDQLIVKEGSNMMLFSFCLEDVGVLPTQPYGGRRPYTWEDFRFWCRRSFKREHLPRYMVNAYHGK